MKKILLLLLLIASFQVNAQFIEARKDSFITALPIQLKNIGEATGKVLTSDALGRATWQAPAGGSGLWTVAGIGGNEIQNTNTGGFWSRNPTFVSFLATDVTHPPTAPVSGSGTRMMWIPSRSAFRCGTISGNLWDANNVGLHSFATGYDSQATGTGNVAIGTSAFSDGTSNTIAIGESAYASGSGGMAIGPFAMADGSVRAIAFGERTYAHGNNSMAIGTGTTADAYYSLALGYYNSPISGVNETSWVSTDPLLYIGNGQSAGTRSNAMVIQKNGVVNINSTPGVSTTFRLRLGGNMSATGTVQASNLRSTGLVGSGDRHVCTDASGNLIECVSNSGQIFSYNVSALGFHPILSNTTPATAFTKNVEKALISFVNNTKSADGYAYAPVELPDSVTLYKMKMHFKQNEGGKMILTFYRVEKQTDAIGTILATIESDSGSGIQEKSVGFDKDTIVNNSKYYYYLKLTAGSSWQGTDMAFRGVVFTYIK